VVKRKRALNYHRLSWAVWPGLYVSLEAAHLFNFFFRFFLANPDRDICWLRKKIIADAMILSWQLQWQFFSSATQGGEHRVPINSCGFEPVQVNTKQSTLEHVAFYLLRKEMYVKRSKVSTTSQLQIFTNGPLQAIYIMETKRSVPRNQYVVFPENWKSPSILWQGEEHVLDC